MEASELEGSFGESFSAAIELPSGTVDVKFPLLAVDRAFASNELGEKYSARNLGVVPVTVALTFDAWEKFLFIERDAGRAARRKHGRHTVLRPLGRKALAVGYRIIIACD